MAPIALPAGKTSVNGYFRTKSAEVARTMPHRQADYPIWHDPEYVVRLATALAPNNVHTIALGIGGSAEATNINTVRNHIIHSDHNLRQYQQYARSIGASTTLPGALLVHPTGSGGTVFEDWLADLELAAQLAAA